MITEPEPSHRSVTLERTSFASLRATNAAGVTLDVGQGEGEFSPVELLLTAIAACAAIDVDHIVSKRDEPMSFTVRSEAEKVRDEGGNHLAGIQVTFDVGFAGTEPGEAAAGVLPRAIQQSHDRLCTVTRTVILGADVEFQQGLVDRTYEGESR